MKRIMLSGMRQAGKTTLVENLCKEYPHLDIYVKNLDVGEYISSFGYDPEQQISLRERLEVQTKILHKWYTTFTEVNRPVDENTILISDQSPIDFMAYTLADINRGISTGGDAMVRLYIEACNEILSEVLGPSSGHLIHVHPWTNPLRITSPSYLGRHSFEEHCRLLILGAVTTLERTETRICHIDHKGDLSARTWALHNYITGV